MNRLQRLHLRKKRIDFRNKRKNVLIGLVSFIVFIAFMYFGFDYAAWKLDQEYEIKMQNQMEWRNDKNGI